METGIGGLAGGPSETPEELGTGECPFEAARGGFVTRQSHLAGSRRGKLLSPARRREAVEHVHRKLPVSERRACRVLKHCRAPQRYRLHRAEDEEHVRMRIIELARAYGRYGYRRITALLHQEGWVVNRKRVERIWREEGLKVPQKPLKRARLWLADGSCLHKRPEY